MSKRLRGVIPLDSDELASTAAYFGVTVGSLFGETTTRPPTDHHNPDGASSADTPNSSDSSAPPTSSYSVPHLVAA